MPHYYIKGEKANFKKYFKFAGFLFIFSGLAFFIYFFFPVISYQLFLANAYSGNKIESPIPKYLIINNNGGIRSLISQGITSLTSDFTDARNWYPNVPSDTKEKVKVDKYFLSIPKLKIENAEVSTKDYDLEKHLVQYFGTSIPGEKGTAVIFGHSTLPYLFNPKNYKTIFATLHTIEVGDEIYVKVKDISYKYKIFSITIASPDDTNILSQSFDYSYITLVTCTPPGTIWKRLIVRAGLDSIAD